MKVNRQNLTEEYTTTSSWVKDFSNTLVKDADYLGNLRSIMKKRNDFDTIEEKMADLKSRVGFDLIKNVDTDASSSIKEASCDCDTCDTCSSPASGDNISEEDMRAVKAVKQIISYISDLVKDRPEIGYGAVMSHCREHPGLNFDRIEGRLNERFSDTIRNIVNSQKKDPEAVEYISGEDIASSYDDKADLADYYSHASG
jgi:hypothetical protein|tara:strand:+ start:280 stop:879 length:600 start_codon:yes stop_codon:yes gene_type:complete